MEDHTLPSYSSFENSWSIEEFKEIENKTQK